MSTGPEDAPPTHGRFRTSQADRERAIAVLKTAFVEDRLDKHEFDYRVGQVLASHTFAELAVLLDDIPSALPALATGVPAEPPSAAPAAPAPAASRYPAPLADPGRTLATAARRSGFCAVLTVAIVEGAFAIQSFALLYLAVFSFIATVAFLGYGFVDAREQHRARAQVPPSPRPGPDRDSLYGGPPGPVAPGPVAPGPSAPGPRTRPTRINPGPTDPTRADLRARTARSRTARSRTDLRPRRLSPT
jgi:Domain of unknown function (DUF1707)